MREIAMGLRAHIAGVGHDGGRMYDRYQRSAADTQKPGQLSGPCQAGI
jgi:hypothetical protein